MASWWVFLTLVLSGCLFPGEFRSIQEDTSPKNAETPADTNDWKGKAAAEGSNGSSQLLPPEKQDPGKKHAKMPPVLPTSHLPMALQEETTSLPVEIMTKVAFKSSSKNVLPETKNKTKSQPLALEMTTMWPWLIDVSSEPPQALLSPVTSERDFETAEPVSKRTDGLHSSFPDLQPSTPSSPFLDDLSTASSHNLTGDSGFSTATQKHTPKDLKSKPKLPPVAATSATPQHLDEILSTSQTLVDDTEFSTAPQKPSLGSGRPGLNPRIKPLLATATSEPPKTQKRLDETVSATLAFSTRPPRQRLSIATTSGSSATTQGKPPLANDTSPLIGKCLLAILLLALVAAIFIVCSGVLAIMLWRQKRAYGLGQGNHTEMVCISSLLSAEKEEEEEEEEERRRRRQSKVKRVQLLGEMSSEMEADNLTLNSFLPEH